MAKDARESIQIGQETYEAVWWLVLERGRDGKPSLIERLKIEGGTELENSDVLLTYVPKWMMAKRE
jgi:hypothetical protein